MKRPAFRGFLLGTGILGFGAAVMLLLFSMKEPPAEASAGSTERSLTVTTISAVPRDIPVTLKGYGEVRPLRSAAIAPQVSGAVVEVHPKLVVGGTVQEGATLFEIDPRTYQMRVSEAKAVEAQWETAVKRLKTEETNDRARLDTLERTRELARAKFLRAKTLLTEQIGNQSEVDSAEQQLNNTADFVDLLERELNVYPIRIEEARQSLAVATAKCDQAELDLARTRVKAPFDAHISGLSIELGNSAVAGEPAVTLSDDSILEILVKLDARDARQWLRFDETSDQENTGWFTALHLAECSVAWTEDAEGHHWSGTLHRVEDFDSASRTLTVAVRVDTNEARLHDGAGLPLVAGMFCEVTIAGETMRDVYELPQQVVTVDDTVFLSANDRLRAVPVTILRRELDTVYVSQGISPGDRIITTRLISPLENTLLKERDTNALLNEVNE